MREINVIINADDCGYSNIVNAAIEKCISAKVLTSTTVMANGNDIVGAKILFDRYHDTISFGCHIVLDDGFPLVKSQILLDKGFLKEENGIVRFTKKLWHEPIILGETKDALLNEASEQIECVLDNGFEVSHFDSHHHVHTSKGLIWLMPALCKKFGIYKYRRIRNFIPKSLEFYGRQAWYFAQRLQINKCKTTDFFASYSDVLKQTDFSFIKGGMTLEIMCHPGHEGDNYQSEMKNLLTVTDIVPGIKVNLINYNQL